ncbi:MAG: GNAT family N-acetyltransferase [Phycisphaerae bacterium]|nr:GNAT family N-acetyltransferase [Phycisphaerae bacterium]
MNVTQFDWKKKYAGSIGSPADAIQLIKPGDSIFIGTGCGQPQHLVHELVAHSAHIFDSNIINFLTIGPAPYMHDKFRDKFNVNSFFIADNVRDSIQEGISDYTPMFLSEIPQEFESGRIPLDIAFISVTPPDANGLCSLGISVDIVKSAAANARYVVAQVNANMPRTLGDCFLHVNSIDMLVPYDEPLITVEPEASDEVLRRIGQNLARLVEDGSTIECGIGRIPQAMAEFLGDKRELGIHTEMFGDWIIDLIECGAITCTKKTINRGKIVASFAMGSQRLYDYIDNNPFFEFHPTEYVNDPFIISQHDKMVGINVGLEVDLTGQVCADSLGYRFYSGIGGQVDFIRGCARSRGGKPVITMPSTAKNETVSRIVAKLTEGAGVVTTRGDIHYVVTEYGIAYLHGKSIRERVLALINIAHPKFRKELIQAAKAQRYIHADQIELPWENVRYPDELEHYDTLRDGTQIFFRPIKPTDENALSEMLYSLSQASVKKRYFTHTKTFPHRDVQKLTNIDYQNELAVVGVVPGPAEEEVVAIAQYFLEPRARVAEVAFIVHDEWQAKGMGTLLLDYVVRIAAQRGIKSFYATVLPENKAMLNIFYNSGYNVNTKFDGTAYEINFNLAE